MAIENITRIKGKKCNLCAFRTDESAINKYLRWLNNEDILHYLRRNKEVTTYNNELDWIKTTLSDNNKKLFNIVSNNNLIGNCEIRTQGTNCVLGILIGEEDERNKGIGTEVISLLVKYAFEELMAHTVSLALLASNTRAFRCYEKCGFLQNGIEHQRVFHHGKWDDIILMEIIADDYFQKRNESKAQ